MLCIIIIIICTDYGTVSANTSHLLSQIFYTTFMISTDTKHLQEMQKAFKTHAQFALK